MVEYLSFEEVAVELRCSQGKVRQLVVEDRTLLATRVATNGMMVESCGREGLFPYDISHVSDHLDDDGLITTGIYKLQPNGETTLIKTLCAGYLRIERSNLEGFLTQYPGYATPPIRRELSGDAEGAASDAIPDPERRLALLRSLGGTSKYSRSEWRFTGIVTLVSREKKDGRKRSDVKTIRADLKEAAQAERDAHAAGHFDALGQR